LIANCVDAPSKPEAKTVHPHFATLLSAGGFRPHISISLQWVILVQTCSNFRFYNIMSLPA